MPPNQNKVDSPSHSRLSQMRTIHLDEAHQVVLLQEVHRIPDLSKLWMETGAGW